jgi:hypothetical protein
VITLFFLSIPSVQLPTPLAAHYQPTGAGPQA